jgi:hypothetical protein
MGECVYVCVGADKKDSTDAEGCPSRGRAPSTSPSDWLANEHLRTIPNAPSACALHTSKVVTMTYNQPTSDEDTDSICFCFVHARRHTHTHTHTHSHTHESGHTFVHVQYLRI